MKFRAMLCRAFLAFLLLQTSLVAGTGNAADARINELSQERSDLPVAPGRLTLDSLPEVEVAERLEVTREKCKSALGHSAFCNCLARSVATGTSFDSYVKYVTKSRQALRYSDATIARKKAIDGALAARKLCVSRFFSSRRKNN